MRKGAILVIVAVIVAMLAASACGGKGGPPPPRLWRVNLETAAPTGTSVSDALAELDALACPEGVDAGLWTELKAALEEALVAKEESRFSNRDSLSTESRLESRDSGGRKFVSTPPTGEANRVNDLGISDNGDGTYTLSWHYRNLGDYDQNGKVAIADITPLAQHFGETYDPVADPNCIQAVIDGSGNGRIGIEDVTPIAVNFGVECAGYSLRGASNYPSSVSETLEIGATVIANATGEGRKLFSEPLPESEYQFFAVAPYDIAGALGELSNVVQLPWHILTVDSAGDVGYFTSLAIVNGHPAISYYDITLKDLKYVRADNATGTVWGTPLTLDSAGDVGYCTYLAVVDGNPAISYRDSTNLNLKYVRASDADGTTWSAPQTLDSAGNVGYFTSLAVVNGYPAIAYFDASNNELKYMRATDAQGAAWETPVIVDSMGIAGEVGEYTSLVVVNGKPAISYYDMTNHDLKYVRSSDSDGTAWDTPLAVDSVDAVGEFTSLAIVNGNPAISYYDATNNDLKYVRATNENGTAWGTPLTLDAEGVFGSSYRTSLAIVNGNPAVAYVDGTNYYPKYIQATDADGTAWSAPVTLETGNICRYPFLVAVNGTAVISYLDFTDGDLRFAIYH